MKERKRDDEKGGTNDTKRIKTSARAERPERENEKQMDTFNEQWCMIPVERQIVLLVRF